MLTNKIFNASALSAVCALNELPKENNPMIINAGNFILFQF